MRFVQQGHGRSGNNRDYVLSTVKSIEEQGFRDAQLHQLALMLHGDAHSLHPPPEGTARSHRQAVCFYPKPEIGPGVGGE